MAALPPTFQERTTGKLVIDAVAAVLDERYQASTDPAERGFLASLADRLATQFHNVPGFVPEDFRSRVAAGENAKAAAASAAALKAKLGAGGPAYPQTVGVASNAQYDAAARHRELVAQQAAAANK